MECNKDEALRARGIAEQKMQNGDFEGATKFALKAQKMFPEIENVSQLLTVCDVHYCAKRKLYGSEMDWYGILQIEQSADESSIKKQYRKLALLLHPDKNKFAGAEAAFKLIGEANRILTDEMGRSLYDMKCNNVKESVNRFAGPAPIPRAGSSVQVGDSKKEEKVGVQRHQPHKGFTGQRKVDGFSNVKDAKKGVEMPMPNAAKLKGSGTSRNGGLNSKVNGGHKEIKQKPRAPPEYTVPNKKSRTGEGPKWTDWDIKSALDATKKRLSMLEKQL